jgi:uncharacterized damage-inducible protein DinB
VTPAHFQTLARYNAWANRRLYVVAETLEAAEYFKPRPAFFGSIHNTLNHILVADRIWLARIEGKEHGITALNQVIYADLAALDAARAAEDERLAALVDGLDEAALATERSYKTSAGARHATRLDWILTHLFNHQTHHRGQVHDMLSQTPVAPPALDLIFFLSAAKPR